MTYILAYLLIGFCTYMLMKNWLYKLTAPIGGFYSCVYKWFERMDEEDLKQGRTPPDWKVMPENFIVAAILTLLMIWCCISWPITLLWMAWAALDSATTY